MYIYVCVYIDLIRTGKDTLYMSDPRQLKVTSLQRLLKACNFVMMRHSPDVFTNRDVGP